MTKTGAIFLGAVLLLSGSFGFVQQNSAKAEEETRYQDSVEVLYDSNNAGSIARTSYMEVVTTTYTTRTLDKYDLVFRHPCYTYTPMAGSCAAVGGGNLIGYYDRFDENLIPNHTSGVAYANTYLYSYEDEAVQALIRSLCDYMGTTTSGTTEKQFINGITNFCSDKGHSVTFTSCMQGSSFSYSKAQSYIDAGQPIVLFLNSYNVGTMTEKTNYDNIGYYISDVPHIMIAFGYYTYVYDGAASNFLSVASGIAGNSSGLYNINYKTQINNALAVNIS